MSTPSAYTVTIRSIETDDAVQTMHADSYRDASRIMRDASINLDHERFYVTIDSNDDNDEQ